ncbi:MAG TPA: hypothetical protein VIH54_17480, partial [Chthoniobacterales bacterium]
PAGGRNRPAGNEVISTAPRCVPDSDHRATPLAQTHGLAVARQRVSPYRPSVHAIPAQLRSFALAYLNQLFFHKPPKWKLR